MDNDIKKFLTQLDDVAESKMVTVKVPSNGKKISFKLPSFAQQQEFVKSTMDQVGGIVQRAITINNIVKDNATKEVDYLTIDVAPIAIAIRKASQGNSIMVGDASYDLDTLEEFDKDMVELESTLKDDDITVKVKVPSLELDNDVNTRILNVLGREKEIEDKMALMVTEVIPYETIKYVESISMGDTTVEFSNISPYERKKIITRVPPTTYKLIQDYIFEVTSTIDKCLTFDDGVTLDITNIFLSRS